MRKSRSKRSVQTERHAESPGVASPPERDGKGPLPTPAVTKDGAAGRSPPAVPVIQRVGEQSTVTVTEAGLAVIERMAADGHPQANIAKALRIDPMTLRKLRRRDPRVQEALDLGLAANERELVSILMELARKGQMVPAMFLLKTKHGYREGEPREVGAPNINIILPGAMNPDEYMKSITVKAETDA